MNVASDSRGAVGETAPNPPREPTERIGATGSVHTGSMAKNVLGTELVDCSRDPLTGVFRDGCCNTGGGDQGVHVVCARVTAEFLEFSRSEGNDLTTPMPQYGFDGLEPGDQWCLCASRWKDAHEADAAPEVVLEATHAAMLEWVTLDELRACAVVPDPEA